MLTLSDRLSRIFKKEYTPILILEIDGLPIVSSGPVSKSLNFDDPLFRYDEGYSFDSLVTNKAILQIVDLKTSSSNFSQRIDQQNSSTSSQTFLVSLVDKFGIVTEWITPGFVIDDIIGKKAKIYLSCVGGIHPFDSVILMNGFVDGESSNQGRVAISLSSAEKLKQNEIFLPGSSTILDYPAFSTTLSADVLTAYAALPVTSTSGFPIAGIGADRVLIQVGSDVLSYSSISGGALNYLTFPETIHDFPGHGTYSAGTAVSIYHTFPASQTGYIKIVDTSYFMPPSDAGTLTCYMQIDDEIIQYADPANGYVFIVARGCFGTSPADHSFGATVTTFFRLQGSMKDLALKLMLSDGGSFFYTHSCDLVTSDDGTITNGVWVKDDYFESSGVVVGDYATIFAGESGVADPTAVIYGNVQILSMGRTGSRAWVVLNTSVTSGKNFSISLKSKYNTLPKGAGLGLTPDLVDVAKHEFIDSTFFGQLLTYDFHLTDNITASDFINQQIYRPSGCYPLPVQGKASLGITSAPVIADDIVTIDQTNIVQASQIKRSRSISKNFYNAVVNRYDPALNGDYQYITIFLSDASIQRIKVPTNPYDVDADGVRYSTSVKAKLETIALKLLQRFQYGAEVFENVQLPASIGFKIQAGDVVVFDGSKLNISDIAKGNGTRIFKPRYMEVIDKQDNPWTNSVKVTLLDTSYSIDGRYGTVAPASLVASAITNSVITLQDSFETLLGTRGEGFKWAKWIGQTVAIRSKDWTNYGEAQISYISGGPTGTSTTVTLGSALSFTPDNTYVMELPRYGTGTDPTVNAKAKKNTVYLNSSIAVVSSSAQNTFTVSSGDATSFKIGQILRIRNPDYSKVSAESVVKTVSGTTITLTTSTGFTIDNTMRVDLIGFLDGGLPYRWA